jgi:hypothetical protein
MYPQCRHVRTDSDRCHAAAIKGSHWCFFHNRLHDQQAKREAQEKERRSRDARRQLRLADGTFAQTEETVDGRIYLADPTEAACPPEWSEGPGVGPSFRQTLELPPVEDSASVQLALIQVLQALAANQLDPRRAGLLLYGLQVASANAKNVRIHSDSIRSITYTSEGNPLATQEHGWDIEDIEEAAREEEEEEYEDED